MNTVQLVGRLTREVDLRFTSSGVAVGTFTIAVNRNFTNQQGEREADFINCVIWRKQAENFANFTRKGSQVGIEGRIQTRNYENQQGQRVYVTEVVVDQFHLLEPKSVTEQRPKESNNSYDSNQYGASQSNYTASPQQPSYNEPQQQNSFNASPSSNPFMEDGHPIDISEDDLPF
ncbi:single-stranded DNA-binding protein [Suicoccus acidiformans]|uniref:Single-stranded DNA-binding protein n=1 Tax=Suicoccus acidiformans TaxID=2036206 RepID=A0A347WNL4_9LACT|nr:single-stranded DNA-binding protein [Suicoccus acidiformans]AXY26671.1 single-stranded DNA-binding protein [Suicoccus acidiformans]